MKRIIGCNGKLKLAAYYVELNELRIRVRGGGGERERERNSVNLLQVSILQKFLLGAGAHCSSKILEEQ